MSTSSTLPRVIKVEVAHSRLVLCLADGTVATAPLEMFPILAASTEEERERWEIIHGGHAVRWPLIDEDISVFSVVHPEECIPMRADAVERHMEKVRGWRARRVPSAPER